MGLHANRLVHQFESGFGLTDRLNGVGKNSTFLVEFHPDFQSQPAIRQLDLPGIAETQDRSEVPKLFSSLVTEEPIILTIGQAREIAFHPKMKLPYPPESHRLDTQFRVHPNPHST